MSIQEDKNHFVNTVLCSPENIQRTRDHLSVVSSGEEATSNPSEDSENVKPELNQCTKSGDMDEAALLSKKAKKNKGKKLRKMANKSRRDVFLSSDDNDAEGCSSAVRNALDILNENEELDPQTYRRLSAETFSPQSLRRLSDCNLAVLPLSDSPVKAATGEEEAGNTMKPENEVLGSGKKIDVIGALRAYIALLETNDQYVQVFDHMAPVTPTASTPIPSEVCEENGEHIVEVVAPTPSSSSEEVNEVMETTPEVVEAAEESDESVLMESTSVVKSAASAENFDNMVTPIPLDCSVSDLSVEKEAMEIKGENASSPLPSSSSFRAIKENDCLSSPVPERAALVPLTQVALQEAVLRGNVSVKITDRTVLATHVTYSIELMVHMFRSSLRIPLDSFLLHLCR